MLKALDAFATIAWVVLTVLCFRTSLRISPSAASSWSSPCPCGPCRRCCLTPLWMRSDTDPRVISFYGTLVIYSPTETCCLLSDMMLLCVVPSPVRPQAVDLDKWVRLLILTCQIFLSKPSKQTTINGDTTTIFSQLSIKKTSASYIFK